MNDKFDKLQSEVNLRARQRLENLASGCLFNIKPKSKPGWYQTLWFQIRWWFTENITWRFARRKPEDDWE